MTSVIQSVQPRVERDLLVTTTCAPSRDIRVTIERFDGLFYDPSDGTFKALGSITDPYVPLNETPPASGSYDETFDVSTWTDGTYNTDLYDHTVDPANPVQLEDNATLYVDGGSGAPVGTTKTKIDHDFGGADALRYVTAASDPVEGADIYAFDSLSYDADAATLQGIAKTETNADGRWVEPFFLDPGSYVILFHKPNEWGPDTTTIVVI